MTKLEGFVRGFVPRSTNGEREPSVKAFSATLTARVQVATVRDVLDFTRVTPRILHVA